MIQANLWVDDLGQNFWVHDLGKLSGLRIQAKNTTKIAEKIGPENKSVTFKPKIAEKIVKIAKILKNPGLMSYA